MSDMAVTSEAVEIPPTPILSSDTTTDASPRTDVNEIPAASDNAADPDGVVAATPSTVPSTLKSSGARHKGGRKDKKKGPRATASTDDADVERKLTHLVIDSGAIIKGAGMTLASAAENFWTVPEVVAEIRDKKARHHLESLPFELKLREPSDEAMKFAAGFARQTGDLRSLSRVDLRVIGLTYMLERQETGASHLRTAPVRPGAKVDKAKKEVPTLSTAPEKTSPEGESAGIGQDESSRTAAAAEVEMDSLCSAVKKAWTEDAADAEEIVKKIPGAAPLASTATPIAPSDSDKEGVAPVAMAKDVVNAGDLEDTAEGEAEDGGEEGEEISESEGGDDDDEWEPEDNTSAKGDKVDQSRSRSGSPRSGATASPKEEVSFTADDFPSLGGREGGAEGLAQAVPRDATTSAADFSETPSSSPAAPSASAPSSWSLMARSNPAPFKIPAKPDPTPLPASTYLTKSGSDTPATSTLLPQAVAGAGASKVDQSRLDGAKTGTSRILGTSATMGVSTKGAEDDDGQGWVNPSNIKSQKVAGIGLHGPSQKQIKGGRRGGSGQKTTVSSKCRVGCVTTDFAMQNVLLQIGLPLLSVDGMAVRRVKQWILRCAACFKTCTEMGRLFCPICGNASLDRVSCSINANSGATYVHLRKNHKVNLRGSKFSIPAPNPTKGRFEGDLLLREDQLLSGIWAQKARRKEKDVSSMFGEDITGNVGLTVSRSADIVVGYGRKNPNSARGRERRGKKGVKKRL